MEKWFRIMGRLEGFSFLILLLVAMPLKYYAGLPLGVKVMGPIHGALFLAYCAWAMSLALSEQWSFKKHILAYVAAVFPCGTFLFESAYLPKG
jgi:integral membrane protein